MISELVRVLLAANTPHEVIIEAIKAVEKKEAISNADRQARFRERNKVTLQRYSVTNASPLNPPLDGLFPQTPLTLNPPLNPPTIKKIRARAEKPKIGLEELTIDHNADWLAEKRSQGRYIHHDEHFVLEQFKNYCTANGVKYADYRAAYRNAFEWHKCQPKAAGKLGGVIGQSDWTTAAEQIIAADRATAAKLRERQGAIHVSTESGLYSPQAIRQDR